MFKVWILSIRIKPLLLGLGPCFVGISLAFPLPLSGFVNLACLLCVLCLQIALHFFNDAFDFLKGADNFSRKGPQRAAQKGFISPQQLIKAGFVCLFLATLVGAYLVTQGGWPIFFIGILSLALCYFYTGGKYSLAYLGLADPFVILFFGLIPTATVFYLNTGYWSKDGAVAGFICGLLALGFLLVNNLRDEEEDRKARKNTLVVRWGHTFGFIEWTIAHYLPYFLLSYWFFNKGYLVIFIPLKLLSFYLHFLIYKASKKPALYSKILNLTCLHYFIFISGMSFLFFKMV